MLARPQHLSYINNFHLFALQGMTELKMYLDWRDSFSTSLPHDLDKRPFLGFQETGINVTLDDAPGRTEDTASVTPSRSCPCSRCSRSSRCSSCQPATRHGKHGQHSSCPRTYQTTLRLPRFLIWGHKTTRRAQGKQEDVQETPVVSHASSAENVSPQLLL